MGVYLRYPFFSFSILVDFLSSYNGITFALLKFLNELYLQRKRKSRKSGTNSTFSFLRKELKEGDLQRLLGFTSRNGSAASSGTPDPLLSSFISPTRSQFSPATRQTRKVSEEKQIER